MTYTKFSVNIDAKKKPTGEKTLFFDAGEGNMPSYGGSAYGNARIRTKREKRLRRTRRIKLTVSRLFRCVAVTSAVLILIAIPLFALKLLTFEEGRIALGSYSFDLSEYLPDKNQTPAVNAISTYYLNLSKDASVTDNIIEPPHEAPLSAAPLPKDAEAIAVDSAASSVYSDTGDEGLPLLSLDLSRNDGTLHINNDTPYSVDAEALSDAHYPIELITPFENADAPTVLVLHTHGTESFTSADSAFYPKSEASPRSTDTSKNVVGLGAELTEALNGYGIATLHCDIMHDEKSYLTSYKNAAATIVDYIAKYPSIKYVIDLHRDSIIRDTNEKIKPVSEICGAKTAQVMFVIGTDAGGAAHPDWQLNLTAAAKIQRDLMENYPTLARPINLRTSRFNQQFTHGSFILEVGSCGNTYAEASRAVRLFASCFARAICK